MTERRIRSQRIRLYRKEEGLFVSLPPPIPACIGVSVVTCTNRPEYADAVRENFFRQTYEPKELIVVLHGTAFGAEQWENGVVDPAVHVLYAPAEQTLGECFNAAAAHAQYDSVAKFDDDDYYGTGYLTGMMDAINRTGAHIVGKAVRFVYFEQRETLALYRPSEENRYASYVAGATLVIRKEVLSSVPFPALTAGDDSVFQQICTERGYSIYSHDRYDYVTIRHADTAAHTFTLDDAAYLNLCERIAVTPDFKPFITR